MSATLIRFKKNSVGDWTFSTFNYDYILAYTPATTIRGAYWYELKRLDPFTTESTPIADFVTLQKAREWITLIGYAELDKQSNEELEDKLEVEPVVEGFFGQALVDVPDEDSTLVEVAV